MSSKPAPASTSSRSEKKASTRAALKKAALACFAELGFRDAQIGDIARRAGVAHGTFYVHFASKEELVDELLAEFNRALVERLERAWREQDAADPRATARRLAEICLDHWRRERELLAAFAERAGAAASLPALRDGINPPVADFLAARLRDLAAAGGAPLPQADLVAHALLGLWTRVGLQYLFGPKVSRAQAVEVLASLSLGALAAVVPALRPAVFSGAGPRGQS